MSELRLPSFLVIGAMKAGTTTLYNDLRANPNIFLPEKELDSLSSAHLDEAHGRERYAKLFAHARPGQVAGEVSATYAKLPSTRGLVDRVGRLLGSDLDVVYLVRNPVDRTVSHHFHRYARRLSSGSIDDAVVEDPCLIDYSLYATQIEPWLELVGQSRVHLVHFERYVKSRADTIVELQRSLSVQPSPHLVDLDIVHNRSEDRSTAVGWSRRLSRSRIYRSIVRPLVPESARSTMARSLLSDAPERPPPPSSSTVERILERVVPDCERLAKMFGPAAPTWDFAEARERYHDLSRRTELGEA